MKVLFFGDVYGKPGREAVKAALKKWVEPEAIDFVIVNGENMAHGHGILVSRYGDIDVKGHLGQIPGHSSLMGRDEKTGSTAMLIQNSGAADFESFFLNGINQPFGEIFHAVRATAA